MSTPELLEQKIRMAHMVAILVVQRLFGAARATAE